MEEEEEEVVVVVVVVEEEEVKFCLAYKLNLYFLSFLCVCVPRYSKCLLLRDFGRQGMNNFENNQHVYKKKND